MRIEPDDPSADWTAAGVYEVAGGLYRIPLPLPTDGLRAVNVYALRDGDKLTMIDAGWSIPEARARLDKAVNALGHQLGAIHRFLVTHVHRDHYTLAVQLRREFGNRISLGIGEQESLRLVSDPDRRPFDTNRAKLLRAGAAELVALLDVDQENSPSEWEEPDEWLRPPTEIALHGRTLSAIHTPGHTQGHVVYADDANQLLFAGDHVLPQITPSIGLEATMARSPLADYLESLRLVRARPDQLLLPAHGPVSPSVHHRVDELLAHHARRLDEMAAAISSGNATAYETARSLRWTRRGRAFTDLDPMNRGLATTETAAHLDLLSEQGQLQRTEIDGIRTYQKV
ncbi:MAG: MBL fold metallo-hydrolase [Actinomycetota bacterium]|nr:MBL fold metallo-hydrolase [Actinomycetota bacterium]